MISSAILVWLCVLSGFGCLVFEGLQVFTVQYNDTNLGLNPQPNPLSFVTCVCTNVHILGVKHIQSSVAPGSQALVAVPADLY